ncbi:MAG: diguanylate cyclase [Rhodocyclaceae bacterium]|nr:diguanylate cyclase [Rhodocyclaceae bacterium]
MKILLLDLQDQGDAWVANGLRNAFPEDALHVAGDVGTARAALTGDGLAPDLVILCDEDTDRLLGAYAILAANATLPATIALTASPSVDAAVCLLRAGIDDLHVLDVGNTWQRQLPVVVEGLLQRLREKDARQRHDAELQASQQYLAQIIDGSSVAMFVIDSAHRVTHWNQACEALTGMAASEMVGTRDHWRAFYAHPRPCMADLILDGGIEDKVAHYYGTKGYRRSATLTGTYEAEDFFPGFGESGRWLFFTAAPLRDDAGRIVGAIETLQDVTEVHRTRDALRNNEALLRQIIQCSSVATFVIDETHRVTHWNHAAENLLGKTAESTIGTRELARDIYAHERPILADLVLDGADERTIAHYYGGRYRKSEMADGIYEIEDFFPNVGDQGRWLHFAAAPLRNEEGRMIGAIETLIDVSERKRAEALLQEGERRLAQIIDGSAVAMFVIDAAHRVTHWNQACAALTGLPAEKVIGTNEHWRAFYADARPCMADLVLDGAIETRVAQYYSAKKYHVSHVVEGGFEAEDFFAAFGSSGRWLYFTAAPLRNAGGEIIGAIETLQDITEQKRAEERLRQSEERYRVLSITDGMTGLYNARHFAQRLSEEMERCQRYRHPLALMVLDVDNFKTFNDTWGHVQGDQVLIQLAECITACLRRTDQAFRYGGEEFVVLLPETDLPEAEAAAERVRALFARSDISPAPGLRVECTASIGVTAFVPGESPRDFVARADSGTYEAKRQGKNRVIRILPPAGTTL